VNKFPAHLVHGSSRLNKPKRIIVHAMAEYIIDGKRKDHAVPFLERYELSAHALAAPDGSIYRCREDDENAWHAKGYNRDSLGIEFLVPGDHDYASFLEAIKHPYLTDAEYTNGLEQVREWMDLYPIVSVDRHSDVSPGRKVDPGDGFPWEEFRADLGL